MPRKFEDWLIWILASFVFGVLMAGCEMPEAFDPAAVKCEIKPGDTYIYWCDAGGFRCTDTAGKIKYSDCQLDADVYCITECQPTDSGLD